MPRLGGIEVLERLRMLDPGLKVILLSGNLGDTADGLIAGVHYQPKPFKNEELIELVRKAIAE
jgi:CheY-like chemotaxis protein